MQNYRWFAEIEGNITTMELKYYDFLDDVLGCVNQLEQYLSLHLTSVAKAIELHNPKINKIIFQEMAGKGLNIHGPGILLTQELEMIGYDNTEMTTYDHFVFYETQGLKKWAIRFTVAHELGHIFLRNPMEKSKDQRIHLPLQESEHLFAVKYNPDDEIQADLFALIMCEQCQVVEQFPFRHPCFNFVLTCIKNGFTSEIFNEAFAEKIKNCEYYARESSL